MAELYNRAFILRLQSDEGIVRIDSNTTDGAVNYALRVSFKIDRDLAKQPNAATISIYNLRRETRALISAKNVSAILEAGYAGFTNTIFSGVLDYGSTVRNGPDLITTLEATDGGKKLRSQRINVSFGAGISLRSAIQRAAEALGLGLGNVLEKAAGGNIRSALQAFSNGIVLSGRAEKEFDKLVKLAGYDWSVQDGQIQLLEPDGAIEPGDAIVLSPGTGLVGSPESGEKGKITARALLIPELIPGRVVKLEAKKIQGFHRIQRTTFVGDNYSQDWYAEMDLKPRG